MNYYSTGTGQSITANYSLMINNNEFGVGIGYNINRLILPDDQENIYYKRQFATEPLHHLNTNVFYHRYILSRLEHINPFLFYDFQCKYSPAKTIINNDIKYHGPYFWLDNTIGAGFNVNLLGNWYLQQKIGAGAHVIIPSDNDASLVNASMPIDKYEWEVIGLLNVGLIYKLD